MKSLVNVHRFVTLLGGWGWGGVVGVGAEEEVVLLQDIAKK